MTRKKEYLWVSRAKLDSKWLEYVISSTVPLHTANFGLFDPDGSQCYKKAKKVFGSFRIGEVKRFSIPLKQIRGKR